MIPTQSQSLSDRDFIELARQYRRELLAPYGGWHYVPMGSARALMVPITVGCSYNACTFCALNKYPYQVFSLEEIESNIQKLAFIHSRDRKAQRRAVLLQGNAFALDTERLLDIAALLKKSLPSLREFSAFARADDVLKKSEAELKALREAGYLQLTLGVESGSDAVLSLQHKGVSRADQIEAMRRLDRAGIRYDAYIMLGLGVKELSAEHIDATASLINSVHPGMLIVVTTVLFPDAELVNLVRSGDFTRLKPRESLEEMYRLLSLLEGSFIFNASHKTNHLAIKGQLPSQKNELLQKLEEAILRHKGSELSDNLRWRRFNTE